MPSQPHRATKFLNQLVTMATRSKFNILSMVIWLKFGYQALARSQGKLTTNITINALYTCLLESMKNLHSLT